MTKNIEPSGSRRHRAAAVSQWRRHAECVKAGDVHFKHSFWLQHCVNYSFYYCCLQLK